MKLLPLACAVLFSFSSAVLAANSAVDSSADPAYDDAFPQWDTGDNGGYGFGPWTLSPDPNAGNAGFFTASSTQNGSFPSGGIDAGGDAWGLYANTNGGAATAVAYRSFTGGSLGNNESFSIFMDNGFVDSVGGIVGLLLRSGNDTSNKNNGQRFEFLFIGGGANYQILDNSGLVDTGIGYTDGGVKLDFMRTGLNSYAATITRLADNSSNTITGTLSGTSGSTIDSVALYNQQAGDGQNFDLFFNNMQIIPEPGVATLIAMAASLALSASTRRRRS